MRTPPAIPTVCTMTADKANRQRAPLRVSLTLVAAALLAALLVGLGAAWSLLSNLPQQSGGTMTVPASGLRFVFGSGALRDDLLQVNEFADGYALLSSGPVKFQAESFRVLKYTWRPRQPGQEAAFFWRRAADPKNVSRTDITIPGTRTLDLSTEPDWSGEILEIGYLVAGDDSLPVAIGATGLFPDSLAVRLQLTWKAWSGFEAWSQRSINFLSGGEDRQTLSLPLLVAAWFCITLAIIGLLRWTGVITGARPMLLAAGGLFLIAWMVLDLRWSVNNIRQVQAALDTRWHADEQQRLGMALDGDIFRYVQRLKTTVLGQRNARILIVGDQDAGDYYLQRAKYHLLPHSAHVARGFVKGLRPRSLDFVIFFGQPANISHVPGWNAAWRKSLVQVDSGEWGEVYRVRK